MWLTTSPTASSWAYGCSASFLDTEVSNARCDEMEGRFLRRDYHLKNVQEARATVRNIPALRRRSTSPSWAPRERPSLSHTPPVQAEHQQNTLHIPPATLRRTHHQENAAGVPPPSRPWGVQMQVAVITTHAVLLPTPPDADPGYFRCD